MLTAQIQAWRMLLKRLLTALAEKIQQIIGPPQTGARVVISSLYKNRSSLLWASLIVGGMPWLLILSVCLVTWLDLRNGAESRFGYVISVLGGYVSYMAVLWYISRTFKRQYESQKFRIVRIALTFLFVTGFLSLYEGAGSYFWFFYSLPILQSIVYLKKRVVVLVSLSAIVTYWLLVQYGIASLHHSSDNGLLVINSLILLMLSLVLYGLFRSTQEKKEENLDLLEKTRRNLVRLATLHHLTERINAAQTLTGILQVALTNGLKAIRCNEGSVMLINPITDELEIHAWIVKGDFAQGKEHRNLTKTEGIAGWVALNKTPYNCVDTATDQLFISSYTGRKPRSLLCVPILSERAVLGVISADSLVPRFFEPEDIEFLSALAGNVGVAIERARLHDAVIAQHEHAQRMVSMLLDLQKATTAMQSELGLAALLNLISMQAAKLLQADSGCILLLDKTKQTLSICGAYEVSEQVIQNTHDKIGVSIAGSVVQQEEPIIAHDIPTHPLFYNPAADNEGWLAIASTPMWIDGKIIGTLDIHSRTNTQAFTEDDLAVLSLMARQAEVAIAKAQLFEAEHQQNSAFGLVQRVLEHADRSKQANRLDALLSALTEEIKQAIGQMDLTLVLKNTNGYWLYNLLNPVVSDEYNLRWLRPTEGSLIVHVATHKTPLFLPFGTEVYCQENKLEQSDTQTAEVWIGIPMIVGDLNIGAMAMQCHTSQNAFTELDYDLFQTVVRQLSSVIYAAWIDEQRTELYQQLIMLQSASEQIMLLAEQNEDWLWHSILTLATAHYGLRFERAIFFLYHKGEALVRGRVGIGNFDRELAFQHWVKDENGSMTWERYLQALQEKKLAPTQIERFVRGWSLIPEQENNAFLTVLQSGEVEKVAAFDAVTRLPRPFVEKFGECDYSLVPVKAGNRVLGVVVLSNPFKGEAHKDESLVYFAALANQAALIYEGLQHRNRLAQFISIEHKVFVQANDQPLSNTLCDICQAVKDLIGADIVVMYPLKANQPTYEYDLANVGYAGTEQQNIVTKNRYPSFFTRYIMEKEGMVTIPDIEQDLVSYGGVRAADHDFIQTMSIRSLIGAPIRKPVSQNLCGILYINFYTTHHFTEQEKQLVELFVHLGNLAISQANDFADLLIDKQAKEQELQLLGGVLQQALVYGIEEYGLVKTTLEKIRKLFSSPDVHFAIALLGWRPRDTPQAEPIEIRHTYYLTPKGEFKDTQRIGNVYFGISGKAMQTNTTQFVPDVTCDKAFYDRGIGTRSEIDVPITTPAAQMIGVLTVESPQAHTLTEAHKEMLERLAAVLGLALDNIRRADKLSDLLSAAAAMIAPTALTTTLQAVLDAACQVAPDLSLLTIWHKSPVTGDFVLGKHFGVQDELSLRYEQPRIDGLISSVMKARKPIWAENFTRKRLFMGSNFIRREGIKSSVVFPLLVADELVGVLFFSYRQLHKFAAEEHLFFPILARIAAASINEALLMEKADKEHKRLTMALDITETVGVELNMEQTLAKILIRLTVDNLFPAATPCILLYNKTTNKLDFSLSSREFYHIDNPEYTMMTDTALDHHSEVGRLALESLAQQTQKLSNINDVHSHPSYRDLRLSTQSQLTVTLYSDQQGLLGVLVFESPKPNAFDKDHENLASAIAKQIQLALERTYLSASMRRIDAVASATAWAADIAHDINGKTGHIRNRTTWLKQEGELSADGLRYVKEIEQSAIELTETVSHSHLYDPAKFEEVDLALFLRNAINKIVNKRGADTMVEYSFNHCCQYVKTHPNLLRRVVHHIVRNALEAMGWADNQKLAITTAAPEANWIEIQIEDNGPGIVDPRIRQNIFNLPIPLKGEGRGYGLLFARDAIERIGGTIRFEPRSRATFVIRIPLVARPSS